MARFNCQLDTSRITWEDSFNEGLSKTSWLWSGGRMLIRVSGVHHSLDFGLGCLRVQKELSTGINADNLLPSAVDCGYNITSCFPFPLLGLSASGAVLWNYELKRTLPLLVCFLPRHVLTATVNKTKLPAPQFMC